MGGPLVVERERVVPIAKIAGGSSVIANFIHAARDIEPAERVGVAHAGGLFLPVGGRQRIA